MSDPFIYPTSYFRLYWTGLTTCLPGRACSFLVYLWTVSESLAVPSPCIQLIRGRRDPLVISFHTSSTTVAPSLLGAGRLEMEGTVGVLGNRVAIDISDLLRDSDDSKLDQDTRASPGLTPKRKPPNGDPICEPTSPLVTTMLIYGFELLDALRSKVTLGIGLIARPRVGLSLVP
jgi:hypothetical protein